MLGIPAPHPYPTNIATPISNLRSAVPIGPPPPSYLQPRSSLQQSVITLVGEPGKVDGNEERPKLIWPKLGPVTTDAQKFAMSQLSPKLTKRCRALMERLICLAPQGDELSQLLLLWVKIMKPRRADWLPVLRELDIMASSSFPEVMELALVEESFEANIRDYTKLIHRYAKQKRLEDAQRALEAMKKRGFICDQITLTVLVDMYSKSGSLTRAHDIFEEIKLLGLSPDKRSYGSMIMAYVRAGMPAHGESLLVEMEAQDVYAGKEVYKAMLRAYSFAGDTDGAERIFEAIQLAGIVPDIKICALLVNAYCVTGESDKARIVLENLRKAGLKPSDKCVALLLNAYEKENNLNKALGLLLDLDKDNVVIGEEASQVLMMWFQRLGIVDDVVEVLDSLQQEKC